MNSRPHISLAVYHDLDADAFVPRLEALFKHAAPIELEFHSIGLFPGKPPIFYIAPSFTDSLRELHHSFHEAMEAFYPQEVLYYLPNHWVPHCTVAIDGERRDAGRILTELLDWFKPFSFRIESAGLIKFYPIQPLHHYSLQNKPWV
jgi:2'-5' RNA ligase